MALGVTFEPTDLRLRRSPGKAGPREVLVKGSEGKAVSQRNVFGSEGVGHHSGVSAPRWAAAEGMEASSTCGQLPDYF